MNKDVLNTRNLKIEPVGDFSAGKIKPRIRIMGKWLAQAGFLPGHRVEIRIIEPGVLSLHFEESITGSDHAEPTHCSGGTRPLKPD